MDHSLALRTLLFRIGPLLSIRVVPTMKPHVLVKERTIEFFLTVGTYASQFQFGANSGTAFLAADAMARLSQRVHTHVTRVAHFFSVGNTGQKKETSGGDRFFWECGCCGSSRS